MSEKFPGMDAAINRVLGEDLEELKVPGELFQGSVEVLGTIPTEKISFDLVKAAGGPVIEHVAKIPDTQQELWRRAATILFVALPPDMWPTAKAVEMLVKTHAMLLDKERAV